MAFFDGVLHRTPVDAPMGAERPSSLAIAASGSCGDISLSGTQSWRSVLPLSFSTAMTGVIGGLMKRKAMIERTTTAAMPK